MKGLTNPLATRMKDTVTQVKLRSEITFYRKLAKHAKAFHHIPLYLVLYKKGVFKNFLSSSHCVSEAAGWSLATILKKRLPQKCFPVNFAKFLRIPFLQNTSG